MWQPVREIGLSRWVTSFHNPRLWQQICLLFNQKMFHRTYLSLLRTRKLDSIWNKEKPATGLQSKMDDRTEQLFPRSEPWEFSQKYDYIHTRVTSACWQSFEEQIAKQAFENLQPGGWFESQEYDSVISCDDDTLPQNSALVRWFHDMAVAGDICDRPTVMAHKLREVYERVGFVDVQEQIFKMPTNGWAKDERLKDIGRMWERNFMSGLAGFSFSMFNRAYNRTPEQVEVRIYADLFRVPC